MKKGYPQEITLFSLLSIFSKNKMCFSKDVNFIDEFSNFS